MDHDYQSSRHFKTRAAGQLYMGPLAGEGYDNRVLQVTLNEMDFKNSVDAERFIEKQRQKYATQNTLCRGRRLKTISKGDSD